MKTLLSILLALSLMIGLNTAANAIPFEDSKDGEWFEKGLSRTYTFNLDTDALEVGDINPGDIITTATLGIEYGVGYLAKIDLIVDSVYKLDNAYYAVILPGEIEYDVFSQVVSDHILNVTIANVGRGWFAGGFQVNELSVEGCYQPVPEPATLLLLGAGLIGLTGYGRKKLS